MRVRESSFCTPRAKKKKKKKKKSVSLLSCQKKKFFFASLELRTTLGKASFFFRTEL